MKKICSYYIKYKSILKLFKFKKEFIRGIINGTKISSYTRPNACRKVLAEEGAVVAGGLAAYAGKMFRFGHMGNIDEHYLVSVIGAIERALVRCGIKIEMGVGLGTLLSNLR